MRAGSRALSSFARLLVTAPGCSSSCCGVGSGAQPWLADSTWQLTRSLMCISSSLSGGLLGRDVRQQQHQHQHQHRQAAGAHPWLHLQQCSSSIHTSTAAHAQDYYQVLGVAKGATDQEIKKAYYKLAKQYHPDTNKENPEAAKQFQDVSKAYETLRDPEKRRMYDRLGREGMDRMEQDGGWSAAQEGFGGADGQAWTAEEIFAHFFGGGARGGGGFGMGMGGVGGMFMESVVRLTFMEAAKGTHKQIELSQVLGMQVPPVEVEIPPGLNTGQTIQVAAPLPGEAGKQQQRVTLMLRIEVEPHPMFSRQGLDVIYPATLQLSEALLGKKMAVPTIDGVAELVVPPCTLNGDVLLMRGKGVEDPRGRGRGDQLVRIRVIKPKKLTPRQKKLLEEFGREEAAAN